MRATEPNVANKATPAIIAAGPIKNPTIAARRTDPMVIALTKLAAVPAMCPTAP